MIEQMLYNFQQKIVNKFKDKHSLGLFLDMGLGKTPLSLGFAETHNSSSVLIITLNCKAEEGLEKSDSWMSWASKLKNNPTILTKHSTINDTNIKNKVLIINYESVHKMKNGSRVINPLIEAFINNSKNEIITLILDESHKIKNLSSIQTKILNKIKLQMKVKCKDTYTYLLTGSPFTKGYIDLYSQLKFLGSNETKTNFIDKFCIRGHVAGLLDWQQPIVGYKNLLQLYDLIHQYAVTIMSDDVVELPERIFTYHQTKQTQAFNLFTSPKIEGDKLNNYLLKNQKTQYIVNTTSKVNNPFFRNMSFPETTYFAETTGTFWLRTRQISIGLQGNAETHQWYDKSRFEEIKKFLDEHRENYVIFYNFTPELFELYDICERLGYKIDVYCGEVKSLDNYTKYDKMTSEERISAKCRVILANFASGSTGMNWQLYNHCIVTSLPLYGEWAQGLKRQHRLGQTKTVFYHIFYQNNWLDNGMLEALQKSTNYNQDMFDSDYQKKSLLE